MVSILLTFSSYLILKLNYCFFSAVFFWLIRLFMVNYLSADDRVVVSPGWSVVPISRSEFLTVVTLALILTECNGGLLS